MVMKYLLIVLVVVAVIWMLRGNRRKGGNAAPRPPAPPPAVSHEPMVACAHCGLHLPQSEAVSGQGQWFCGDAHRIEHERVKG
jgi:uncharacterized protein